MDRFILFGMISAAVIMISWRTLFRRTSHGLYRFFSWECIAWLFASNYQFWFNDPFSIHQLFSWLLLIISAFLVLSGSIQMHRKGQVHPSRNEKQLYPFEQTTALIDTGIFRSIRHPLYSSLLFLTWGIFLKGISIELFLVSVASTVFLYLTAFFEEKECLAFFGNQYKNYKERSKRFIPYLF